MVNCCAPGCTNYSSKSKASGVSYHLIPKDKTLQKAWIARLRRDNLPPLKYCYVCSEHFAPDCFESDLKQQLMPQESIKRRLKRDAVPSIFSFGPQPSKKRRTSELRMEKRLATANNEELSKSLEQCTATSATSSLVESLADDSSGFGEQYQPETLLSVPSKPETRDASTQCSLTVKGFRSMEVQTTSTMLNSVEAEIQVDESCFENISMFEQCYSSECEEASSQITEASCDSACHDWFKQASGGESTTEDDTEDIPPQDEKKYIVFKSCLFSLLRRCLSCGETVIEHEESTVGSLLSVNLHCINGHQTTWKSQPIIRTIPAGNLLLAASTLFSGNTYEKIRQVAFFLNLEFISESSFYSFQNHYLFPVVDKAWQEEKQAVADDAKKVGSVNLSGDGRCDSPGHNAKYGTYTMMADTGKIVTFNIVQSTEVSSSNAMEKEAFERCLSEVEKLVPVKRITTDRHVSIASAMKKKHHHIDHQYDVWHLSKSVVKKLTKKAKVKENEALSPWIKSISNHLWWCSANCNKNADELVEKWKSVLYHMSNKHHWTENKYFHKCCHPPLSPRQEKKKKWLSPTSQAYIAAEKVIYDKRLLNDIRKLTEFCHTGQLEVYHSVLLKYCPKREHFSFNGMVARTQLAALDHNNNVNREQAVVKSGAKKGEARYKMSFTKTKKQWVVKAISENKDYHHVDKLLAEVLNSCKIGDSEPVNHHANLPKNIATSHPPNKETLVKEHKSRFV